MSSRSSSPSSYAHSHPSSPAPPPLSLHTAPASSSASPTPDPSQATLLGLPLKYVSLLTLALQNATLTIMMHYSRVATKPGEGYSAASAVLLNELLKGSISAGIALHRIDREASMREGHLSPLFPSSYNYKKRNSIFHSLGIGGKNGGGGGGGGAGDLGANGALHPGAAVSAGRQLLGRDWAHRLNTLRREVLSPDSWKLSIPAILYVIQNNLQFVAASNLDVATFQVTYQMKILTTALFSVLMLRKKLGLDKWLALLGLAMGVGIVQIQSSTSSGGGGGSSSASDHVMHPLRGFAAVAAACFTSGLAGVYFEKVLKGSSADLWVRNVQLSLFSLVPALVPVVLGSNAPAGAGLFARFNLVRNFTPWAWATVLTQVFGGLITAVVIKYSDNILKGFATSMSIVLSFVASVALFDFHITPAFVIGASTVLASTMAYNRPSSTSSSTITSLSSSASATLSEKAGAGVVAPVPPHLYGGKLAPPYPGAHAYSPVPSPMPGQSRPHTPEMGEKAQSVGMVDPYAGRR